MMAIGKIIKGNVTKNYRKINKIKGKDKDHIISVIVEINMMVNGIMIDKKEKELWYSSMVTFMMETGTIIL